MSPREMSNDELAERLADLKTDIRDLRSEISTGVVKTELYEAHRLETGRRIGEIETQQTKQDSKIENLSKSIDDRFRQVVLLVSGAILTATLGLLVKLVG